MANTYFELRTSDGGTERVDVSNVEAAKAVAKSVTKLTGSSVSLHKVTEIDIDAPPRTRNTSGA